MLRERGRKRERGGGGEWGEDQTITVPQTDEEPHYESTVTENGTHTMVMAGTHCSDKDTGLLYNMHS